ncbi:hypothetical protein K431DRAFT_258577 [Polychaeton citri CBS 116435]|uniref:WD40 repeat-like protein n=1 Tax=Polychaeton citri CBS 116435 TaxID=1314669 RepID=A0A9P4PZU4_9PEZI|nr:hypothetical protein K431DRAFT_258577 [Polychaeton citri CBS 116435]
MYEDDASEAGFEDDTAADLDLDEDASGTAARQLKSTLAGGNTTRKGRRVGNRDTVYARVKTDPLTGEKLHTRGLLDGFVKGSSSSLYRRVFFFGPSARDYTPFKRAVEKWIQYPCLPTRKPDETGHGGFHASFYAPSDGQSVCSKQDWSWYFGEAGKEKLERRQRFSFFQPNDNMTDLSQYGRAVSILVGPYNHQKKLELRPGEYRTLADACHSEAPGQGVAQRLGFILNAGREVRCVEWAPNEAGQDQYLAVGTDVGSEFSVDRVVSEGSSEPELRDCSIQIWKFKSAGRGRIDHLFHPKLLLRIATAWGGIRQLKWCQIGVDWELKKSIEASIGLVAAIWTDGALRVFEVPRDPPLQSTHLDSGAFENKPPDTVYTTLTWLSPSRLAAGCANGSVAIWDLPVTLSSDAPNPRPTIYSCIAQGYIMNMTSCWPSRPDLLLITDMSGHVSMTDLRQPSHVLPSPAGTVQSHRSRHPNPTLTWYDYVQCAITAEDQTSSIRCHPIRRFWTLTKLGRLTSPGTTIACSPCHPYILVSTQGGEVLSFNPLARIVKPKGLVYQLDWFWHEWRPLGSEEQEVASADRLAISDGQMSNLDQAGVARITEGFRAERIRPSEGVTQNTQEGVQFSTVYEPKTAVSAVAWNPNTHVGGWAAAGMADGLVRVEDLAL